MPEEHDRVGGTHLAPAATGIHALAATVAERMGASPRWRMAAPAWKT